MAGVLAGPSFIRRGARLKALVVRRPDGSLVDVALGYRDDAAWAMDDASMGVICGRYAGRIADARFALGDREFQLVPNAGRHLLHGGAGGFATRSWAGREGQDESGRWQRFHLISDDGDQGFPGRVDVTVNYHWSADQCLTIDISALADADTPFNITQHIYWNLNGSGGCIGDHWLQVHADRFLPVDGDVLPLATPVAVEHTPFDLREPRRLGDCLASAHPQVAQHGGFDHCWLPNGAGKMRDVAVLTSPASGLSMTVATDQPCLQVYTGNALGHGLPGKHGLPNPRHGGIALETQGYPDAPNRPDFPPAMLLAGEPFATRTQFRFHIG